MLFEKFINDAEEFSWPVKMRHTTRTADALGFPIGV